MGFVKQPIVCCKVDMFFSNQSSLGNDIMEKKDCQALKFVTSFIPYSFGSFGKTMSFL